MKAMNAMKAMEEEEEVVEDWGIAIQVYLMLW